jgi:glutamine phosphoribosylpyrophosphate amidotransferase
MKDSDKRALRTAFHVLVALLAAVPAVLAGLPTLAVGAQVLVVTAVISKVINALEEAGVVPAWLKPNVDTAAVASDAAAAVTHVTNVVNDVKSGNLIGVVEDGTAALTDAKNLEGDAAP